MTRILGLCGSLRATSTNHATLLRAAALAPSGCELTILNGVAALPAFSPDLDKPGMDLPAVVLDLYAQVEAAAGLVIACPEYAHGIPGAFKNALDWLVGSTVFPGKPVALINIAPRSTDAQFQLREVLATMSAEIVEAACCTIAFPRSESLEEQSVYDAALAHALDQFMRVLCLRDVG